MPLQAVTADQESHGEAELSDSVPGASTALHERSLSIEYRPESAERASALRAADDGERTPCRIKTELETCPLRLLLSGSEIGEEKRSAPACPGADLIRGVDGGR